MNNTTIEIKPSLITGYNEIRCVYGLFFSEEIVSIDMVNIGSYFSKQSEPQRAKRYYYNRRP